ncbi:MAG: mandelate racemase [Candidatus Lumbricidophila eiseniae]|uniref:Mandelate racemase n=1 Tax=Candidatus Lumbricidiphila eiseniae TaxID=1969409 RepID=A0A2A6FS94_9MICO|nr:MAG: mandelate racemase [Candidatus Lumbricidophila eiseniae]
MKIDSIDMYYLRMPEVLDIGDGSQDMLLVRVEADGSVGWGECEASPLTTIASFVTPLSHSACHGVRDSVIGQRLDTPADIVRIAARVRAKSVDLLQAEHALSGIEIAMWDLLGRVREQPVWTLLGQERAYPKTPYASSLFGNTPQDTFAKACAVRELGYRAAKFGWGPYGLGSVAVDADHVNAAREGLGSEGILLVDAGTVFGEDVEAAALRLPALEAAGVVWLEEPFISGALRSYRALSGMTRTVKLAGGEGAHNPQMAELMIDHGGIGFVQIDTGRIGGIADAARVARYAQSAGVRFVNHTFTSHLALSASLQPFAGAAHDGICEYPVESQALARGATTSRIDLGADGTISVPDGPGLGLEVDIKALAPYLVDVEIVVDATTLFRSATLRA